MLNGGGYLYSVANVTAFSILVLKLHVLNLLENNAVSLLYPVLECDYYRVERQRAIVLVLI